VALDDEDERPAQRTTDQDTIPGTGAGVELVDGYKSWEDAALDDEPWLNDWFGTDKVPLSWLEDHEIPYDVHTQRYFRGLLGMHQNGHPNIPPQRPVFARPRPPFDYGLRSSYDKDVVGFCADFTDLPSNDLELSKLFYDLSPSYDTVHSGEIPCTKTVAFLYDKDVTRKPSTVQTHDYGL
jgi:hypothetical protein